RKGTESDAERGWRLVALFECGQRSERRLTVEKDALCPPMLCPPKTCADLEIERMLSAVASRSISDLAKRLARDLPFLETREQIQASLVEIDEMRRLD